MSSSITPKTRIAVAELRQSKIYGEGEIKKFKDLSEKGRIAVLIPSKRQISVLPIDEPNKKAPEIRLFARLPPQEREELVNAMYAAASEKHEKSKTAGFLSERELKHEARELIIRADHLSELNAMLAIFEAGGIEASILTERYGASPETFTEAFADNFDIMHARRASLVKLRIMVLMTDAEFSEQGDILFQMISNGRLLKVIELLFEGSTIHSLNTRRGILGAYELGADVGYDSKRAFFAKPSDPRPDLAGADIAGLMGFATPRYIHELDGKELTFGPNGGRYHVTSHIGESEFSFRLSGISLMARAKNAVKLRSLGMEGMYGENDVFFEAFESDSNKVIELLGHAYAGFMLGGFRDRRGDNVWALHSEIIGLGVESDAKIISRFLMGCGYDVDEEAAKEPENIGLFLKEKGHMTTMKKKELLHLGSIDLDATMFFSMAIRHGGKMDLTTMEDDTVNSLYSIMDQLSKLMKSKGTDMNFEDMIRYCFGNEAEGPFLSGVRRRIDDFLSDLEARARIEEIIMKNDEISIGPAKKLSEDEADLIDDFGLIPTVGWLNGMPALRNSKDARVLLCANAKAAATNTILERIPKELQHLKDGETLILVPGENGGLNIEGRTYDAYQHDEDVPGKDKGELISVKIEGNQMSILRMNGPRILAENPLYLVPVSELDTERGPVVDFGITEDSRYAYFVQIRDIPSEVAHLVKVAIVKDGMIYGELEGMPFEEVHDAGALASFRSIANMTLNQTFSFWKGVKEELIKKWNGRPAASITTPKL